MLLRDLQGYGDISARTPLERFFCVWVMVLGSFLFGVLIGSVPAAMNPDPTDASSRYAEQEKNVKEYLQEHQVAAALRGRILQYYEYRFPDRRFYDIEALIAQLPRSIQEALALHMHRDLVASCVFLGRCSPATLSDVCLRLRPFYAARGDVIVHAMSEPDGLYFLRSGSVMVTKGGKWIRTLRHGDVFGENCLIDPDTIDEPVRVHAFIAIEPVEMLRIYLDDLEILAVSHIDFTLTPDLTHWPAARKVIVERARQRLGTAAQDEVLDSVQSLKDEVNILRLLHQELQTSSSEDSTSSSPSEARTRMPPTPQPLPAAVTGGPAAVLDPLSPLFSDDDEEGDTISAALSHASRRAADGVLPRGSSAAEGQGAVERQNASLCAGGEEDEGVKSLRATGGAGTAGGGDAAQKAGRNVERCDDAGREQAPENLPRHTEKMRRSAYIKAVVAPNQQQGSADGSRGRARARAADDEMYQPGGVRKSVAAGEGRQAASNGKSQQFALRRHRSGPELHAATFNASAIAAAPSDGAHAPPSAAPHSQHLPASQATPRERRRLRVGHPGRTQSEQALSLGNPARDGDWGHTLEAHVPWRAFPPRGTSPVRSPSSGRDWKQERRIQRRARRVPSYSCLKEPVSPPSLAGSAPSATFAHPTVPGLAPSPRPTIPGLGAREGHGG